MSFTRHDYPISQLASGHHLSIPVFSFSGTKPGAPKTYIQANIHGAELQGNAVIYELLAHLNSNPPLGDILLVPFANPYASNFKLGPYTYGRFDPSTGLNWNRIYFNCVCADEDSRQFPAQINIKNFCQKHAHQNLDTISSLFKKEILNAISHHRANHHSTHLSNSLNLALTLQSLSASADIVLDLHTGPHSAEHLYATCELSDEAQFFDIPHIILIPPTFEGAMEEAAFYPWQLLKEKLSNMGHEDLPLGVSSFTVELGSEEKVDHQLAKNQVQKVVNYLKYKKALPGEGLESSNAIYTCALKDFKVQYCPRGGLVDFLKKPGSFFKKDDILAQVLSFKNLHNPNEIDNAITPIIAKQDGIIILASPSSGLHQGMELFSYMLNPNKAR